jgi:hypothetical protein
MRLWLNNLHFFVLDIRKINVGSDILVTRIFEEFEQFSAQEKGGLYYSLLLKNISQDVQILIVILKLNILIPGDTF